MLEKVVRSLVAWLVGRWWWWWWAIIFSSRLNEPNERPLYNQSFLIMIKRFCPRWIEGKFVRCYMHTLRYIRGETMCARGYACLTCRPTFSSHLISPFTTTKTTTKTTFSSSSALLSTPLRAKLYLCMSRESKERERVDYFLFDSMIDKVYKLEGRIFAKHATHSYVRQALWELNVS